MFGLILGAVLVASAFAVRAVLTVQELRPVRGIIVSVLCLWAAVPLVTTMLASANTPALFLVTKLQPVKLVGTLQAGVLQLLGRTILPLHILLMQLVKMQALCSKARLQNPIVFV